MSLDTYANLKLEIIDWSHRDDLDLKIDTFIDLAESEMYANSIEPLQIRDMETRSTASMDSTTPSRYVALPTGFKSMRKLRVQITNGESYEIISSIPSAIQVRSGTGRPFYFCVTSQLEFDINPDIDYALEMQYMADFTPLSSSNTTNVVLTNYPTIYLFGSLWALKKYANEDQDAAMYYSQFIEAIRGANAEADMGRYGPAPSIQLEGFYP